MIGEKWLSDVVFTTVQSKADISKVKKGANGDFQPGDLSRAVNTDQTNDITVRSWLARANDRKSTIVFCVDIDHVTALTNKFRQHGIDARFVTGDTPKVERSSLLDAFKKGEYRVLVNCGVFTEGTDIPNIDCVLLARPTRSRNLLVQMIGRGMRLHPGKANCHIIDMVASLETGIVTTPTLFGLDPSEVVNAAKVTDLVQLKKEKEEASRLDEQLHVGTGQPSGESIPHKVTFTDYDSVFDLIKDTSGDKHIRSISSLAWVETALGRYTLAVTSGDFLTLECVEEGLYSVRETGKLHNPLPSEAGKKLRKSPYMRPREIAVAETFVDAVHAADTYASERFPYRLISKDQAWRKGQASEGQLAFLNKLRPKEDQLTPDRITKGQAGDMITKIKHGARGRFGQIEAAKRKEGRAREKAEKFEHLKRREHVKVGPLVD
jgi:ATP-dependent helicase IRC3